MFVLEHLSLIISIFFRFWSIAKKSKILFSLSLSLSLSFTLLDTNVTDIAVLAEGHGFHCGMK